MREILILGCPKCAAKNLLVGDIERISCPQCGENYVVIREGEGVAAYVRGEWYEVKLAMDPPATGIAKCLGKVESIEQSRTLGNLSAFIVGGVSIIFGLLPLSMVSMMLKYGETYSATPVAVLSFVLIGGGVYLIASRQLQNVKYLNEPALPSQIGPGSDPENDQGNDRGYFNASALEKA